MPILSLTKFSLEIYRCIFQMILEPLMALFSCRKDDGGVSSQIQGIAQLKFTVSDMSHGEKRFLYSYRGKSDEELKETR